MEFSRAEQMEMVCMLDGVLEECLPADFLDDVLPALQPRKRGYVAQDREAVHERLMSEYFNTNPIFTEPHFCRRFRMPKAVFLRILHALEAHDPYFTTRYDAVGRVSLSPHQKCTAAIRQLCYGIAAGGLEEYFKIGETMVLECVKQFFRGLNTIFGPTYRRKPTRQDMDHILAVNEGRGFLGMLGSLDCMHWEWKNCPTGMRGSHSLRDHGNRPTVVLEAVATRDLWIWHSFFGMAGSNNDLTVLNHSKLFADQTNCWQPPIEYTVNGNKYTLPYYLVDGIYPPWSVFVKTIPLAQLPKPKTFAEVQEACQKDVERAFGALQARFHSITRPSRMWMPKDLSLVMNACVTMHNMIFEAERHKYDGYREFEDVGGPGETTYARESFVSGHVIIRNTQMMHDESVHYRLQDDLVEHIWNKFGV